MNSHFNPGRVLVKAFITESGGAILTYMNGALTATRLDYQNRGRLIAGLERTGGYAIISNALTGHTSIHIKYAVYKRLRLLESYQAAGVPGRD